MPGAERRAESPAEPPTEPPAESPAETATAAGLAQPAGRGPVVAITGAARGLGHALALRLAASPAARRVIAIDDHRGDVVGVTWRLADVRDPALACG